MKDSKFEIYSYLFPLVLVVGLCLLLFTILNLFESAQTLSSIFGVLAYLNFTALWFGGIPYLLFLAIIYVTKFKLGSNYFNFLHAYSPLLFTFIFALFWLTIYLITNRPPTGFLSYLENWLSPVSLGITIGGYVYFGIIYLLLNRNNKLKRV